MATQTAIALTEVGKPLEKITLPVPQPKDGEVLLKVEIAGVNPMDMNMRDKGTLGVAARLPAILASDVVGTVFSNGPNTTLPIGTKVFSQVAFMNPQYGAMQQYVPVFERWAIPVPKNASDINASTFPINALTSGVSIFGKKGLNIPLPGTDRSKTFDYTRASVVIFGGGTNTGRFAIQFLRNAGVGTIITTAGLGSVEELKGYGATHIIDRKATDVKDQIRKIVGDNLIHVFDTFPSLDHDVQISVLSNSKKGTYVRLVRGDLKISQEVKEEKKAVFEDKITFGASSMHPEFSDMFWKIFVEWVEEGKVVAPKTTVVEGLDAEKINAAIDVLRGWGGGGKVTIRL